MEITVTACVKGNIEKVWDCWNNPTHITKWCQASSDWHAPHAEVDLRKGGSFKTTMASKDGCNSFDFVGVYDQINHLKSINYTIGDGRKVYITFNQIGDSIEIAETFEPENIHSAELQQAGWQAILDSFKNYVEEL